MKALQKAQSADDYEKITERDGLVFYLDHALDNIEVIRSESEELAAVIGKENFKAVAEKV